MQVLKAIWPEDERVPRTARSLAALASEHGWDVRITWAYGGTDPVESIAVRMAKPRVRLAAVWVKKDDVFSFANAGTAKLEPLTLTQCRARVVA